MIFSCRKAKEGKTDLESHLNDLQKLDRRFKHGSRHDLGIVEVEREIQEVFYVDLYL